MMPKPLCSRTVTTMAMITAQMAIITTRMKMGLKPRVVMRMVL